MFGRFSGGFSGPYLAAFYNEAVVLSIVVVSLLLSGEGLKFSINKHTSSLLLTGGLFSFALLATNAWRPMRRFYTVLLG